MIAEFSFLFFGNVSSSTHIRLCFQWRRD